MTPQENLIKHALREIADANQMLEQYPHEEKALNTVITGWQAVIIRLEQAPQACSEAGILCSDGNNIN